MANRDDLVLTRVLSAPREAVFSAWTVVDEFLKWWPPAGLAMRIVTMDIRPGGRLLYTMTLPDGQEMWGRFVYQDVQAPSKLVYINGLCDPQGALIRHPGAVGWPAEIVNTLALEEHAGVTTMTLRGSPHEASPEEHQTFMAARDGVQQGFAPIFDQLEAFLANRPR